MHADHDEFQVVIFALAMALQDGEDRPTNHDPGLGNKSMADFDFELLSLTELKKLQKDVAKAITSFEDRQKAEARAKVEAFAKDLGYTLSELMNAESKTQRTLSSAKFRHPENPTLTWSGRGRKPAWFVDALASGKTQADMLIV